MLSTWRTPLFCVVMALFGYALIEVYTGITDHFDAVKKIEADNKQLSEDNDVLNENINGLTAALQQEKKQNDLLVAEMDRREKAQADNARLQAETEEKINQLRKDSSNAIADIAEEIKRAGLRNLRLPDSVVRVLRERAQAVNAGAKGGGSNAAGEPAKAESKALSGVPGS